MNRQSNCPDPQSLVAFIEGTLPAGERSAVLAHLDECDDCMSVIDVGNEVFTATHERAPRRAWWLAVAAAVAIGLVLGLWQMRAHRPAISRLVAEAPRDQRLVEPRLAGGFPWAAYHGPERAAAGDATEERMKWSGIAAQAIRNARVHPNADEKRAAGVAMMLAGRPNDATEWLRDATALDAASAATWSDLAAAEDAAAVQSGEASRYATALAAADRALRTDPRMPEALFNRALILEHMHLTAAARQAWERYLAVDASSPWAKEAREHLAALPASSGAQQFERDRPLLERAALSGDRNEVKRLCAADAERTRTWGEGVYLGTWGECVIHGDEACAQRNLTIARAVGDGLAATNGESLLRDAVQAIDRSDATVRATLAAAHSAYMRGRITYARHKPSEAEPLLREAAARFGSSPMALVARYFAANTRVDQSNVPAAHAELEHLGGELLQHPQYIALGAQVQWELALCHSAGGDWSGSLPLFASAEKAFRQLGERSNLGAIETLLAETLASAGRNDDAAAARIRAFALASSENRADRLPISLTSAAITELRTGRRDESGAMLQLAADAARDAHNDTLLVDVLMQSALMDAADGRVADAQRNATAAHQTAQRITDALLRERSIAYANIANAAAVVLSNPAAAHQSASAAIDFLTAHGITPQLPLAFLLRARSALRLGNRAAATADLDRGLAADARPFALGSDVVTGTIFDAAAALCDDAIALAADRGDAAAVFRYAELKHARRTHGRGVQPVTLEEFRARLGGTGSAVLEIAVLPESVVTLAITSRGAEILRRPIARGDVATLAARGRTLTDEGALRELHALLIAPAGASVGAATRLVVVADSLLDGVPFAALLDAASQPLVARMPVATAMTAASLETVAAEKPSLLLVALSSGGVTAALPAAEIEMSGIASSYGAAQHAAATLAAISAAAPRASIVHITGHTAHTRGNDDTALLLDGGPAAWQEISALPLQPHAIVVLAGCETLRAPRGQQSSGMSIGAAFMAAGASDVVGTLAPVADRDAATLFQDMHRALAGGESAAAATRDAQLLALRRGDGGAWRALSVLTARIN